MSEWSWIILRGQRVMQVTCVKTDRKLAPCVVQVVVCRKCGADVRRKAPTMSVPRALLLLCPCRGEARGAQARRAQSQSDRQIGQLGWVAKPVGHVGECPWQSIRSVSKTKQAEVCALPVGLDYPYRVTFCARFASVGQRPAAPRDKLSCSGAQGFPDPPS